MFTGVIKKTGKIVEVTKKEPMEIVIESKGFFAKHKIGESISVNGACLTITRKTKDTAIFSVTEETISKTNFKNLKKNSIVNLEQAMTLNKRLEGHIVQGHVDAVGTILETREDPSQKTLRIRFPKELLKFLPLKGSVTVNGVSLTISFLDEDYFEVSLVSHTLKNTNLKDVKKNDEVNLEIDTIARYIKALLDSKEEETKYEYLLERGLI